MKRTRYAILILLGIAVCGLVYVRFRGPPRKGASHRGAFSSQPAAAVDLPRAVRVRPPASGSVTSSDDQGLSEADLMHFMRVNVMDDPRYVERLAREHRERFPTSNNSDERDVLLISAIHNQRRIDEARLEALEYFKRYPDGRYKEFLERNFHMRRPSSDSRQ